MLNRSRLKTLARISLAVLCVPLCLAGTCPNVTPTGSCCISGACTVTTQAACTGTWTANGTCTPNPCTTTTPTGSCCISGACTVTTQAACIGTWTSGGTCTPNPCPTTPTTLLSEQAASVAPAPIPAGATPCAGAATGLSRTFNAVAGKLVTVNVTGPTSSSRPQIRVADILANQVANTGPTPSTQANSTTFTPTTSNLFVLQVNECVATPAGSVYTVLITQAP